MRKSLWHSFLDILFPRNDTDTALDNLELRHFAPFISLREVESDMYVVLPYQNPLVRASVHALKYKNRKEIGKIFGQILHGALIEDVSDMISFHSKNVQIVPIPLSTSRMQLRGYNQAEIIARAFAEGDSFPSVELSLLRTKDTPSQTTREGRGARIENLKDAFRVPTPESVRGKAIILVDDVITTGATMQEAKKALLRAGAARVYGIAVAH